MFRISTTQIESFRLYMTGDWMAEEELFASIRGQFVPNRAVQLGKAFDDVLNEPERYRAPEGFRANGIFLPLEMMHGPLRLFDRRGVFQVKSTKRYGDAVVVAVADQLLGATLIENKTTCSNFDANKYERSYQWRFMCDVFDPREVVYHVFCLSDDEEGIGLKSTETIKFYPYPELHQDCIDAVGEFLDYCKARDLLGVLAERYRAAEAA